ncbi:MAG: SDR family oxidoreductase [Limnohabitans sp.]|nr:SDR family oxidoreductase [Limnohabitans sp.]
MGRAVVEAFRQSGATVIASDLKADVAIEDADFSKNTCIRLDVTQRQQVHALQQRIAAQCGPVDTLINVAGVVSFGSAQDLSEEEWDRVIDINLKGSFLTSQAVLAGMKEKKFGRIIQMGSVVGKNAGNARPLIDASEQSKASNVAYGVSKAGIHIMTGFLGRETASFGITVNALAPDPIVTAMTTAFPANLRALIPVGRMGETSDIVHAVMFLAHQDSGFITGEILDVNGGMWSD